MKKFIFGSGFLGCLGISAVVFICIGLSLGFVTNIFKSSDVYQSALAQAQSNPEVVRELGTPIQAGWFVLGSISTQGLSGDADLQIPISGPSNSGMLYASARRANGVWQFYTLAVTVNGRNEIIDLR